MDRIEGGREKRGKEGGGGRLVEDRGREEDVDRRWGKKETLEFWKAARRAG